MIIFNMGIPRSGTVWAFNVFRELWTDKEVRFSTRTMNGPADVEAGLGELSPIDDVIAHFHEITPAVERLAQHADVRPFFSYRDPRDVVVSLMGLHDATFEEAVQMTARAYQHFSKAICLPGIMLIPYNHIVEQPESIIFQMATKLGILLDLQGVRDIAARTAIDRHRRIMHETRQTPESSGSERVVTVPTGTRQVRIDRLHYITDRHIQSGRHGRWREELEPWQQQAVQDRFARLVALLGFDEEPAADPKVV